MNATRRWMRAGLAGLSLMLTTATGCQTWVAGMTLPSPGYLRHPPQYFAPSPSFPLPRELARQEEVNRAAPAGGGPEALPPPVPGRP
jgi:hypothetical protein